MGGSSPDQHGADSTVIRDAVADGSSDAKRAALESKIAALKAELDQNGQDSSSGQPSSKKPLRTARPLAAATVGAAAASSTVSSAPASTGDDRPERDADDHSPRSRALFANLSGTLISLIVHTVILLVLALLSIPGVQEKLTGVSLTSSVDEDDDLELEDFIDALLPDEIEFEDLESIPVTVQDPGMAALGDIANTLPPSEIGSVLSSDISSPIDQIGASFGELGKGWASEGPGRGGASFCGVRAGGSRFVFVVDGSASMKKNGWEYCTRELVRAVRQLKPYQYFAVILFASNSYRMFGEGDQVTGVVKASPENIARLERWLYRFELHWGTTPMRSIQSAMAFNPSAVFFLTDGQFHDTTQKFLAANNVYEHELDGRTVRVPVHTIAFFNDDGAELMNKIANDNGGTYRYIQRPPGHKPAPGIRVADRAVRGGGGKKPAPKKGAGAKKKK